MKHLVTFAAAVFASAMPIGAAAAQAQAVAGYYQAVPATAPTKPSLVTRSTLWYLHGATYVAARAPDRDPIMCQLVAQRVGALAAFTAGGKPYDAAALAQCNAKVKPAAAAQVASTAGQGN